MGQARDGSAVVDVLPVLSGALGAGAAPAWLVARAAGVDVAAVDGLPAGLLPAGRRPDGWVVLAPTRRPVDAGRRREVVGRVAAEALDRLGAAAARSRGEPSPGPAGRWVREHRECLLGVAGAANEAGLTSTALSLAVLLWGVGGATPADSPPDAGSDAGSDAGFVTALTDVGTRAAVAERAAGTMADLLRSAWVWFARRGDPAAAERYAVREWDLWRRAGRPAEAARLLWWRAGMFRLRGRGDLELRCFERLESLCDETGDRAALARVRAATAAALLSYDRADAAADWARRAEGVVRALPDFPPVEQALVLEWSGRALWAAGATGPARRRFSEALALLVDVDDEGADRVRLLLAHDQDRPLPPAAPDRYPPPEPSPAA